MKNINQVQEKGSRPWQGTILAVSYIIAVIIGSILLVNNLVSSETLKDVNFILYFSIPGFVVSILILVLSIKSLKGIKGAITGLLVFAILGIFSGLSNIPFLLIALISGKFGLYTGIVMAQLIFSSLMLWLVIVCLKHPFYNKK
jgi:hypothetical protein